MIRRQLVTVITLAILFMPAVTPAADQLWPLRSGYTELDKSDLIGNHWTVRVNVMEKVTLEGQNYFHILETDYDPSEGDVMRYMYIRSTDTELYIYNGLGLGETLAFKLGPVGTNWTYANGTMKKEIVAIEEITIPYGGPYTAYKFKHYDFSYPDDRYNLEWVVPGLPGIAKEEDHWVSDPLRIPVNSALTRLGTFVTLGDINSDDKIDLSEAIYALQVTAGIRP